MHFQRRIFGNVKFDEHHGTISLYDGIGKTLIGKYKKYKYAFKKKNRFIFSLFKNS